MEFDFDAIRKTLREEHQIEFIRQSHLARLMENEQVHSIDAFPVEFSARDIEICKYIIAQELTMAPREAVINTILSAKHAVARDLPGDFVECGVWRGGNALAAKLVFEDLRSPKRVWLFDTFKGMTAPGATDIRIRTGKPAMEKFVDSQEQGHNAWCYASLDEVRGHLSAAGADMSGVRLVEGDIAETLRDPANVPERISVLRLDTDWYESTRIELETLYPRLVTGGVLIVDDYGCWDGCRRAVDEFFATSGHERPFFQVVYVRGTRAGIKP